MLGYIIYIWFLSLIPGRKLLKPVEYPKWQKCLLIFITNPFPPHLNLCEWGDFWKAPKDRISCQEKQSTVRGWELSVSPSPILEWRGHGGRISQSYLRSNTLVKTQNGFAELGWRTRGGSGRDSVEAPHSFLYTLHYASRISSR